jgi:3-oxoacyl-[acyl-carrier protein] reductase
MNGSWKSQETKMTDLSGKVALVTGSSRGLGKAIIERFARCGATVAINYSSSPVRAAEIVDAVTAAGGKAISIQANMSHMPEIERLFAQTLEKLGRLDIVVANAGVEIIDQPCLEFTEADYDRLFALNTKGTLFTLQNAARHVADNGRIIYIGSSTTNFALEGCGLYGSSKMAPRYMVEVLAKEIGHRGVTVNTILPTAIADAGVFTGGANPHIAEWVEGFRPIKRMGTVEDVADAAEYLAGPLASFVSGQHLLLSGGAHT